MQWLEQIDRLPTWLGNILLIVLVVLLSLGLRFVLYMMVSQWLKLRNLLPKSAPVSQYFGITGFLLISAILIHAVLGFFRFPESLKPYLEQCFHIYLIVSATWFLIRASHYVREVLYEKFDITGVDNFRQRKVRTQIVFIVKVVVLFLLITGFASVLMTFSGARKLGASILASAGVASIVVGLAAQKSLSNFIAGFQIAFTQPIRIDDVLIVEKEWGRVEEITLTYVVVKLWDLRRMILPITYFVEKPFENWTRNSANILGYSYIYTDYTLPIEPVRKELRRVCEEDALWDGTVCILQVTDCTERTIQLRALVSARNASDAFDLRCNIREKLIHFINEKFHGTLPKDRVGLLAKEETGHNPVQ